MKTPQTLRKQCVALVLFSAASSAFADDAADCQAADGTFLTGVVQSSPQFVHGKPLRGVELSHTHIKLLGDSDSKTYDVAIDNVFASGYRRHQRAVPSPLSGIHSGDHLELCGIPFNGGIHWVHTNCGDQPTPQDPNGWLKELSADGAAGENLEGSTQYCYLWSKK